VDTRPAAADRTAFRLGDWLVEPSLNRVARGSQVAHLRPMTMDLLVLLADHAGQVVSKDAILRDVWRSKYVDESVLARSVGDLRRLFGDEAGRSHVIETIPKRGYRLLAPVVAQAEEQTARPSNTVAVLPFVDLGHEGNQDYLCDGLAEELIHNLSRVPGLRVVARTSAFAFKDRSIDVREIGRQLNAGTVLEGGLRRDGKRLRITVQLIDAVSGYHLWSERFERTLDHVFALEDEIAAAVADKLRASRPGLAKAFTSDPEVFTLCLKARHHHSRQTAADLHVARGLFEEAIDRDPGCAEAYAGLAACCWDGVQYGFFNEVDDLVRGRRSAGRAVESDPALADARAMLGVFLGTYDFDWAAAEHEFAEALRLAPTSPTVRERYAMYWLQPHLRLDEAVDHLRDALAFDPLSPLFHAQLGHLFLLRREYQPACHEFAKALSLDPDNVMALGGHTMSLALLGRVADAWAVTHSMPPALVQANPLLLGGMGAGLAAAGRVSEARHILESLADETRFPRKPCWSIAWVHLGLGEMSEAFTWLASAVEERDPKIVFLRNKPFWDPLRADPRFDRLLQQMKLIS